LEMTQKSLLISDDPCKTRRESLLIVMARARPGELTARRHAFLRISVKAQFTFYRSSSICEHASGRAMSFEHAESSISNSRRTLQTSKNVINHASTPAGSFSFWSSVYWHSYVEAALLQLAHIAPQAMVSTEDTRYFVNFNTPETICGTLLFYSFRPPS